MLWTLCREFSHSSIFYEYHMITIIIAVSILRVAYAHYRRLRIRSTSTSTCERRFLKWLNWRKKASRFRNPGLRYCVELTELWCSNSERWFYVTSNHQDNQLLLSKLRLSNYMRTGGPKTWWSYFRFGHSMHTHSFLAASMKLLPFSPTMILHVRWTFQKN